MEVVYGQRPSLAREREDQNWTIMAAWMKQLVDVCLGPMLELAR